MSLTHLTRSHEIQEFITRNMDPFSRLYVRDSPEKFRMVVEAYLRSKGFSFQHDFNPVDNKGYFICHYKGEFFDAAIDTETILIDSMDSIYLSCYNHLHDQERYNKRDSGVVLQASSKQGCAS